MGKRTNPEKQSSQVCRFSQFVIYQYSRIIPGSQHYVSVHTYPFPLTVYVIVSALPCRSAVAVALTEWERKIRTRCYLNGWTETANLRKRRT